MRDEHWLDEDQWLDGDLARPVSARARVLAEQEAGLAHRVAAIEAQKAKLDDMRAAVQRGREALEARYSDSSGASTKPLALPKPQGSASPGWRASARNSTSARRS
jgi:hypothetical protein